MDIIQLRYFISLAEGNTMKSASEQLHVSQSTISMSLSKLEDELGVDLFDRVGRNLKLNANGAILLKSAQKIISEMQSVRERIKENAKEEMLLVNVVTDVVDFAENSRQVFEKCHPGYKVNIKREADLCRSSFHHSYGTDFAISLFPDVNEARDTSLLLNEPMNVIFPSEACPESGDSVSMKDIAGHILITSHVGSSLRRLFDGYFQMAYVEPTQTVEITDPEAMVIQAAQLHGAAFIPSSLGTHISIKNTPIPGITILKVYETFCSRNIYLGRFDTAETPAIIAYYEFINKYALLTMKLGHMPDAEEYAAWFVV
mgnify:CR=1 FL=1